MTLLEKLTLPFAISWSWLVSFPKIYSIPVLLILLLSGLYFLWFGLETKVVYAYSGSNCVSGWTWYPNSQQQVSSQPFAVSFERSIRILNTDVLAREACFSLTKAAEPKTYSVMISPFSNFIAASRYSLTLPKLPKVSTANLNKPIPLTKPVVLGLSAPDKTYSYGLHANDRMSECNAAASNLACELTKLELEQGKEYEFAITRYFDKKPVETVVEKQAEILRATTVADTSIKPDELVLAKPVELVISFDKPISKAEAELFKLGGDNPEMISTEIELAEAELKLKFSELPREADFEVKIDKLLAKDESSLVEPYRLRFKTSGGPKVSAISIPKAGVALGAKAVISFDQELSLEQDVASMVTVEGGQATIYRNGNTVVASLNGIRKCADFTVKVGNEIQSIYGVSGNSGWSYSSRTICHTVEVFGYSTKGRPLLAYYFGSGGATILYTGAIHGNEISSSYLMDNWINELELNARNLPAGRQIVVVPEINPDGVAARSRNNANNVDLNRNFAVSDWQSDITDTYGNPIPAGGGKESMSEPETKAIAALVSKLKPRLTINYHSIGGLVIANQAGNSSSLAQTYARMSGYGNATGKSSTTFDYAISGTLDDWMAEKLGLPTILVELGSHTYSQFPLNKSAMWEMARW